MHKFVGQLKSGENSYENQILYRNTVSLPFVYEQWSTENLVTQEIISKVQHIL